MIIAGVVVLIVIPIYIALLAGSWQLGKVWMIRFLFRGQSKKGDQNGKRIKEQEEWE